MGRFLNRDSLSNWGYGSNLGNGYTYVANNPVNYEDTLGLQRKRLELGPCNCNGPATRTYDFDVDTKTPDSL